MSPDEYLDDDEPRLAPRSIFSTGWFRALIVLGILGVILVFAVPYVLEWLEPPPPRRQAARPEAGKSTPPAVKTPPAPVTPARTPAPTAEPPRAATPPPSKLADATTPKGDVMQPAPARPERPLLGTGGKTTTTAEKPAAIPAPAAKAPPAEKARPAEKALPPTKAAPPVEKALPAAKATPAEKPAVAKSPAPPRIDRQARAEPPAPEKARPAPTRREPARREAVVREAPAAKAPAVRPARGGDYWVQVGAFQDEKNAERLAVTLREGGQLTVEVTRVTRGGGAADTGAQSQHQVFVSGSNVETVSTALRGSGKSAQAAAGGVAVQPALSMREAVDLSQKLRAEGLNASIRRVGGGRAEAPGGGAVFYVVRAGGYPSRVAAADAKRALEGRGMPGFVARGPAK